MSTLSVPLTPDLETFIADMVEDHVAPTKAEVVRQSLRKWREDQIFERLRRAEQEIRDGKGLRGDISTLIDQIED